MSRFRNWLFTDFCENCCLDTKDEDIKYVVYQREVCPSTGKKHYQGYIEFKKAICLNSVKTLFKCKCHLERRKGTQKQAIDYCTKDETSVEGTRVEIGCHKDQGFRSDLDNIHESIINGYTPAKIILEHGGHAIKYIHMINTCVQELYDIGDNTTKKMNLRMKEIKERYKSINIEFNTSKYLEKLHNDQ